ncbi:MAG: tRNA pseudouridine(13) synthase TruD [Candidatus Omnitrophica bacterium]|nr:tRNA pseudouridine(13) synthase TruD [Candidatus Omnitrophota bacterium]MCM8793535.1 tRNA pseudouridine(13) synthase TruD [Candidatus Omnitrophota bacterium]
MKIKVKPEDFIVEEKSEIKFKKAGKFKVYLLTKRNFNTIDALKKLSQKLNLPLHKFSYGGRKDRYGLTQQYIAIEGFKIDNLKEKSFQIQYLGETNRPLGPDMIISNDFKIVVRDLEETELNCALKKLDFVRNYGFPNYFDDQRFGNYSPLQGFFAEKLIRREFNGAVKIYLTAIHPEDKKEEKLRKKFFFDNWRNWDKCLLRVKTDFERMAFSRLREEGKVSLLKILNEIPRYELSMLISSFQSYLWNILLEKLIKFYSPEFSVYKGNYWNYVFYESKEVFEYLKDTTLPLAAKKTKMPDVLTERIYREILEEHNLKPAVFNLREFRKAYFKPTPRKVVVVPEMKNFWISRDELYRDKQALTLHFQLPRGSYGTMLVKALFAK